MSLSIKKKTLRKAIATVTMLTSIVWLSGVAMFSVAIAAERPSVVVSGVTVYDGDLISSNETNDDGSPTYASLDIYIAKVVGAKKFKRLILNPQVFDSYGHLKWGDVREVSKEVVNAFNTSSLVRVDTDPAQKVYALVPNDDTGAKSWVNLSAEDFLGVSGTDSDSIYTINATDGGNYVTAGNITTKDQLATFYADSTLPEEVAVGEAAVSLSPSTPVSGVVAKGAQNAEFTKVKFSAGDTAYTVNSIAVTRSGIAQDTDLASVKLYDGATQIGSSQAVNTNTHKATFSNLNWTIPANTSKTLTIKANIATGAGTNSVILGIASSSDITTTASVGGVFPINGNAMTIASISVGQLTADVLSTPAASNLNSGSTQQQVASIRFTANATEGMSVRSFKLTQVGTSGDSDTSNITVKYGGETIATVAGFISSSANVTLSPALVLNASQAKTVDVYLDIVSGINTLRTIQLEITQAEDVIAVGSNSQGSVTVVGNATFPEQGASHTISQGTLATALDASLNPSAQSYVKGTTERTIAALRFSTSSVEGSRLTQIKLTGAGTATPTDVNNFTLWKDGTMISTGSISGTTSTFTVQFGTNTTNSYDDPGLFDVAASSNATVVVKADVSSAATTSRTIIMNVSAATDIKADGLSSQKDLPSASVTGTTTGSTLTVSVSGALTVNRNPNTPASATVGKGIQGKIFTKIDLVAGTGEDITVSSVVLRAYKNAAGTGTVATATDITNMKVLDASGNQLGSTVASPSSGVGTFSINKTIKAGETLTLSAVADIPSGSGASSLHIDLPGAGTIADDVTSTGVSSTADISETGSATGLLMTVSNPTIVASMSSTPSASTKVLNATGVTIGRVLLTAGSAEDVKISTIKVSFDDDNVLNTASAANTDLRNAKIFDGTTQVGQTVSVITDGTADYAQFTGITNLTVPAGATKSIDVKVDIAGTSANYYAGVPAAAAVTGSGATSTTSVNSTVGAPYVSALMTLSAQGTLTTTVDAGSPANTNISVGTVGVSGVEFAKFKMTTANEPVYLKALTLTRSGGADTDFVKVQLYADGVQIGPDGYLGSATVTFNFPTGSYYEIPADSYKVITVKANLNGVGSGVTHADAPIWTIAAAANISAEGKQSSATISDAGSFALTPAAKTLYKTVITADVDLTVVPSNLAASASATQKVLAIKLTNGGVYDATITKLTVTPSYTSADLGDTGYATYWNDDLTALTGGSAAGDTTTAVATTLTITANNTIAAGTSRVLYVVADTIGATTNETFQLNVSAVADLGWTPNGGSQVTTLTKNLPLTGPSFKY